ncbi:MAG: hypothetical protein OXE87_05055 [Chloroflexi bacterium]|nr:hypothetical protein [Chloroflexota bacterium]
MLRARLLPPAVFLGGALAISAIAVVMTALIWAGSSPASAQEEEQTKVPAKPTGLSVAPEQGSLDVSADWDDVEGADDYLVRWRPKDGQLNDGVRVNSSSAAITVDDYGEWVVRVQACNDAGCGKPLAQRFSVEPAPEPTPTPTPEPTPEPTATPEPMPEPGFRVSIAADATELKVNEEVTLTAVITNAPAGSGPTYQWQLDLGGGSWYSAGTEATFSYLQSNAGFTEFRVTVTYGSADSATSDPITITWIPPNRAPMVDDQAERYQGFTGTDNAPRGTLVSKVYDGIFSDPDGDELTYTVSVPADRSELVDTVYVLESAQRVFIRLEAEDDWGAVEPQLPTPLVTTVTLTATDPDGLSASVTGEFQTNWEQHEILAVCDRTPQVRDALVALVGKACKDIGAADLIRVVKLDLSNTGMSSLRPGDFSGMSSLRQVDMSSNNFTSWTDACAASYGNSVQNINLTNNKLGGTGAQIESGCFTATKFPNLVSLHLAATRINSLAGNPFDGLTKLEILDLSQNQITAVPVAAFEDLSNLWYLDLGRNALTSSGLPASATASVFDDLSNLEWLALNNQKAHDASDNFEPTGNPTLTSLHGRVFIGLTSLKELDLANNGFTKTSPNILPDAMFTFLTSLESLALFGNAGAPWTATQLTALGVRAEASVTQVVTPPSGFAVEPVSGGVKLTWDDPSDTNISHEYRYLVGDGADWTAWTDISSTTTSGTKLEHTVSSDVSSGKSYVFQLRSEKSGAHSWRANADCTAIFGTSGNDTLTGSLDPNCIIGLAGNDTLKAGPRGDNRDGGAGTDTASYQGSARDVTVNLSDDTASGGAEGDSLDNIENIIGSNFGDTLTGDANANNIRGHGGDDTVEGLAGGDKLWGEGGTGDTLSYASSDAGVTVSIANRTASGGHAQGDTGLGGFENLIGSEHDDTLTGDANANVIEGGDGEDTLSGGGGNDTLSYASSGWVQVSFATTPVTAKRNHAEGDTISGFENFLGSDEGDAFTGDANNNVIYASAGRDTYDGGDGNDTLTYASFETGAVVNVTGEGDIVSNVETIIGTNAGDTINGDSVDNTINGNAGDDTISGGAGDDIITGGNGLDTLNGGAGDDTISGGNHNDRLKGGAGADTIDGGNGGDTVDYSGSPSGVTVNLTTNVNTGGHAQGDKLNNIEHIEGSSHADNLTGDEHVNYFWGGAGADAFDGKGGEDWVWYTTSPTSGITIDMVTPANSTGQAKGDTFTSIERVSASVHNDTITGNNDNNHISGEAGNDTLKGGGGDDIIYGGEGQDTLYGDAGDDKIHGSFYGLDDRIEDRGATVPPHNDVRGGAGNDKLAGLEGWATLTGGTGTDEFFLLGAITGFDLTIADYASGEKIWICRGSGGATSSADASDGEVWWTGELKALESDNVKNDWVYKIYQKDGSNDVYLGNLDLNGYSSSAGSDMAWSDPAAAVGTGCNFIEPWIPWNLRDKFPPPWKKDN